MPKRFLAVAAACLLAAVTTLGTESKEIDKARLKWNAETTVGDYERCGRKNPKWDANARKALRLFAETLSGEKSPSRRAETAAATRAALEEGCDDPLVHYIGLRQGAVGDQNPRGLAKEYADTADRLADGGFSPIRVFYAYVRAAQAYSPAGGERRPAVRARKLKAAQYLAEALRDKRTPYAEVFPACNEMLPEVSFGDSELAQAWDLVETQLDANWPDQAPTCLLKGRANINKAWAARGEDVASKVASEGWKTFAADLALAKTELEKGWSIDPNDYRIARQMITVSMGLSLPRVEMEKWFGRAMAINTNGVEACSAKLLYLSPKWLGSDFESISFGRECAASTKWGGRVPLILFEAHSRLASRLEETNKTAAYWRQGEVWRDVHASFEKFFALNPDETVIRQEYVKAAYNAGAWRVFLEQCQLLNDVNYEFFGGRESFRRMKEEASRHMANGGPGDSPGKH